MRERRSAITVRVYRGPHAASGGICKRPALERPIFVVGCSRAGTTLVYKTFSESRELGTLQRETHDFWAMLHPLAERDWRTHALTALDASERDRNIVSRYFFVNTGRRRIVDKNNQNGLCVPYLFRAFSGCTFCLRQAQSWRQHSLLDRRLGQGG